MNDATNADAVVGVIEEQPERAPNLIAVTDSNILVEIFSPHDVLNAYRGQTLMTPTMEFRRRRVRDSLLLAMHFHKQRAGAYGLPLETLGILEKNAPPRTPGLFTSYVEVMNLFVQPVVWPEWRLLSAPDPETKGEPKGSAADTELVLKAAEFKLPLITHEGVGPTGITDKPIRKKATEAGVQVFAAAEFWAGKLDEKKEIRDFLRHYRMRSRRAAADHENPQGMLHTFRQHYIYFVMVLIGDDWSDSDMPPDYDS